MSKLINVKNVNFQYKIKKFFNRINLDVEIFFSSFKKFQHIL